MTNPSDLEKSEQRLKQFPASSDPVQITEDEDTGDRFLLYSTTEGVRAEFRFRDETLWMTQAQIAELFGKDQSNISRHIRNIFDEEELQASNNMQKMHIANSLKPVTIYSLDTVISIGYRVTQSKQATLLRRWATTTLVQFATSGFVVDKKRLSHPDSYDRLKELKEIIRDIRASEANVYREIRSICAMCQDYNGKSNQARQFYARIQNKLLWAVTSHTAPEIIQSRADAKLPNMGLQTWPNENIRKTDVTIAHNYLVEAEIREKNRFTVMLLDFFEDRVELGKMTLMQEAESQLNRFLKFNERPVLSHKGKVKRTTADEYAKRQYNLFAERRRQERLE